MAKRIKHNRKNNVRLFIDHCAQNTTKTSKPINEIIAHAHMHKQTYGKY